MAAVVARENGLRVEDPAVLADLFSLMMHLRPARVATCVPKLRTPIVDWLDREITVTTFLSELTDMRAEIMPSRFDEALEAVGGYTSSGAATGH